MKDPLQKTQTPYEVLGVEQDVTQAGIDAAFKQGLVKRRNVQELMAAKTALQRPLERSFLNLLLYDQEVLKTLDPCPVGDGIVLLPENRAATARAWEAQLIRRFPDVAAVRTLAVFHYWWAIHEEERVAEILKKVPRAKGKGIGKHSKRDLLKVVQEGKCRPGTTESCSDAECEWRADCVASSAPLRSIWERVVALWVMVASSIKHHRSAPDPDLHKRIIDMLNTTLHNLGQAYRTAGFPELATTYADLELMSSTEQRTAAYMADADLRLRNQPVACGLMMLRMSNMQDQARSYVEGLMKKKNSPGLKALKNALSSYSSIAVLIDTNRPEEALKAISKIPLERHKDPELDELEMRAWFVLGQQRLALNEDLSAIDAWAKALSKNADPELAAEIRATMVSACKEKAAGVSKRRRDDVIAMLRRAVEVHREAELKLTLAELLTSRAIEIFVDTQEEGKKAKGSFTREMLERLEKALDDLKEASRLGSKRAADQMDVAGNIINEVKLFLESGFSDLPEVRALFEQAMEAAERNDRDKSISLFRKAIEVAGDAPPKLLFVRLATQLNNRGLDRANRAIEQHDHSQELQKKLDLMFEAVGGLFSGLRGLNICALCGGQLFGQFYNVSRNDGRTLTVCVSCENRRKQQAVPSSSVRSELQAAFGDLDEAVQIDPSNDVAQGNLTQVRDVMNALGISIPSRSRSKTAKASARYHGTEPDGSQDVRERGRLAPWLWIAAMLCLVVGIMWVRSDKKQPEPPKQQPAPTRRLERRQIPEGKALETGAVSVAPVAPVVPAPSLAQPVRKPGGAILPKPGEVRSFAGFEMVWCPPGDFMMGSPATENGRASTGETQHKATVPTGFWISKYEVTQVQWRKLMKDRATFKGDNLPVHNVTWDACRAFVSVLNAAAGKEFRIPTDVEWEYACRAGTTTAYSFGDDASLLAEYAWYDKNGENKVHQVGAKKPNAWGLCDMHGNVFEWCVDSTTPGAPEPANKVTSSSSTTYVPHGLRGGSFTTPAAHCRAACQGIAAPRNDSVGFRLVLSPDVVPPATGDAIEGTPNKNESGVQSAGSVTQVPAGSVRGQK